MRKSTSGFTLVEILIVVVAIGILSTIIFVSYNNVERNARNADRFAQIKQWVKEFELYKAKFGQYPVIASGNYCLGRGFPLGSDNQGRCRDSAMTDPNYSYLESNSAALMTELAKVGTSPTVNPQRIHGDLVGPYINYWGTGGSITQVFEGGRNDCPASLTYSWDDGNGVLLCAQSLGR
jgi:prepilin-type N-terminal cleavage/methylation domain-containing protein